MPTDTKGPIGGGFLSDDEIAADLALWDFANEGDVAHDHRCCEMRTHYPRALTANAWANRAAEWMISHDPHGAYCNASGCVCGLNDLLADFPAPRKGDDRG